MDLIIRNSFFRDWDDIRNKDLNKAIELVTSKVKKAKTFSQIPSQKIKKICAPLQNRDLRSEEIILDIMHYIRRQN